MLNDLLNNLETSKKDIQVLRGDLLSIGYTNNDQNTEISRFIMDDLTRLGKDFMKLN
jgi:hypothetical protein